MSTTPNHHNAQSHSKMSTQSNFKQCHSKIHLKHTTTKHGVENSVNNDTCLLSKFEKLIKIDSIFMQHMNPLKNLSITILLSENYVIIFFN